MTAGRKLDMSSGVMVSALRVAVVLLVALSAAGNVGAAKHHATLAALLVLAGVYATTTLVVAAHRRGTATTGRPWIAADLVALSALTYAAGGAHSGLDLAFTLPPAVAAVMGRLRAAVVLLGVTLCLYAGVVGVHALTEPVTISAVVAQLAETALRGGLVVVLAVIIQRRATDAEARARASQRLVGQVMVDEEAVRRELASELHDVHLQNLYAAQFELQSRGASDDSLALASGLVEGVVAGLRERIADLYPATLEHAGLAAAIAGLAARRHHNAVAITTDVSSRVPAGAQPMAFACAREFLNNAIRHAHADQIDLIVDHERGATTVTVRDDGRGISDEARSVAVLGGHIGLAALQDRIEALGGRVVVERGDTHGTLAIARWPASGSEAGASLETGTSAERSNGSP